MILGQWALILQGTFTLCCSDLHMLSTCYSWPTPVQLGIGRRLPQFTNWRQSTRGNICLLDLPGYYCSDPNRLGTQANFAHGSEIADCDNAVQRWSYILHSRVSKLGQVV